MKMIAALVSIAQPHDRARTRQSRARPVQWAVAAAFTLLAACGGGSEEPQPPIEPLTSLGAPEREWVFTELRGSGHIVELERGIAPAGDLLRQRDIGRVSVRPPNVDDRADLQAYSDAAGKTYWVDAEAPLGEAFAAQSRIGGRALLMLDESYRKNALDATLRLTITAARLQVLDYNGGEPLLARCPWATAVTAPDTCFDNMYASVSMQVIVTSRTKDSSASATQPTQLYQFIDGAAVLTGWHGHWSGEVNSDHDAVQARSEAGLIHRVLWRNSDFRLEKSADGVSAELALPADFPVDVDLTLVPVGSEFTVEVLVMAVAENRRGRESYASARLRDPQGIGGVASSYTGLTPTHRPARVPASELVAKPPCAGPADPAAGTLQFSRARYALPEFGVAAPIVFVTRTGGSSGTIAARLKTQDGTARAGTDYVARELDVVFGDGDTLPRAIRLAAIDDATAQGERAFRVVLGDQHSCARLGRPAEADVVVIDDEYRVPVPAYTVGGVLTGLRGGGLVLEDAATGSRVTPSADGAFAFDYRYPDRSAYDVRVVAQPANPAQTCTVTDGRGTIAGANVANVRVDCATSVPPSGLDPTFGDGGRLYDPDVPIGRAVAIQATGRIVVLAGMWLAAYDANGRRDATFGTGGIAPVVFNDGFQDEAYGLLRQPDDKLVVVGRTRVGTYFHMAVKRFNADGSVDTAFGTNGLTTLDPYADLGAGSRSHYAYRATLAPDGRVLVAGVGTYLHPTTLDQRVNFAVARLNADGSPDASFGRGGTSIADIGGDDWGYALAVQPGGRIVVAGRTNQTRGTFVALARWRDDGLLDTGDPRLPEHYGRDGSGFQVIDTAFNAGSGQDMVMLDSGAVVVATPIGAAHPTLGFATRFGLVTADVKGQPTGVRDTPIGPDNDVPRALLRLPDGRLVLVGQVSSAGRGSDFGIVRYQPDLSPDATFGSGGVQTVDFYGSTDDAAAAAPQPDGRVVVVGAARNGANTRLGIVRLLP